MLSVFSNLIAYLPKSREYKQFLENIFSSEAALSEPSVIVCPQNENDILEFIKIVNQHKLPFTVCSGGLSAGSIQNNIACLALNKFYNNVTIIRDGSEVFVRMQGGATVEEALRKLNKIDYHIPFGVSPLPGLGLVLRGGIGHLSRSEGLTLDQIVEINFISAIGEQKILQSGSNDYLWRALRGAAPRFGVVSEVVLKALPGSKVTAACFKTNVEAFASWLNIAANLPYDMSTSLVLGSELMDKSQPVLFGYLVKNSIAKDAIEDIIKVAEQLVKQQNINWCFIPQITNYCDLPAFDIPQLNKKEITGKIIPLVKSYLMKNDQLKTMTAFILEALNTLPNPLCRIDLQHMGGMVTKINSNAVFQSRDADWNVVITGIWTTESLASEVDLVKQWVHNTLNRLSLAFCGVYSVEIRNNQPETEYELELAYKKELVPLRQLISSCDKYGLRASYPL